ncbi:MAG: arginine--pyruvate transaminase AruH [Ktedonobacterales bacterium]
MFRLGALAYGRGDLIHLEFGEPGFPTPDHIVQAAITSLEHERQGYGPTNGPAWLRAAIAARVARVAGHHPTPDQVVVTAGGTGALLATLLCLCVRDDEVLVPDPGWPGYDGILATASVRGVRYPLLPADGWLPDLEALDALVSPRTRVLLVNSPSNPGGAVFPRRVIEALVAFAHRHDLWILSDECYDELIFAGEHVSPAALAGEERVVTVGTCSKSYAMTGWRVGWAVAPAQVASILSVAVGAQVNNLPLCALRAAEAALTGPQACVARMRDGYRVRRDLALEVLQARGLADYTPEGAFYLLVNVALAAGLAPGTPFDSIAFAEALLAERAVVAAPGGAFGATIPGHMRISLAGEPEPLRAGLAQLLDFAAEWAGRPA